MRTLLLLASACLAGGTVEAQATSQGRARTTEEARRAESDASIMRDRVMHRVMVDDSTLMNRATLGVTLGGAAHKRDTLGVFVEAVAEDGPAELAGVYEGHRIAFINGIDVRATAADAGDAYLSGVGRHRLSRAMRDVAAGSTVTLRVWTGSGYRDVQVTSGRFADVYKHQRFGGMFGDGAPGGFGFAPAMEHLRIERHSSPLRGAAPTPRAPRAPRAPRVMVAPDGIVAPPAIAPVRPGVRRYTI